MARCTTMAIFLFIIGGGNVTQTVRLKDIAVAPTTVRANLVANESLEEVQPNGIPVGWLWDRRNTDATCKTDETVAHSGKRSLHFTNGTPFGAHVYGMLWAAQPIRLKAGAPYTLSAFVKSDAPGVAWIGGGRDWQIRLHFPSTQGKWQRVWRAFTPSEADADFIMRLITESPTNGFWVDDIKLEEGDAPSPSRLPDDRPTLLASQTERAIEGDGAFEVAFELLTPKPLANATLEVTLSQPRAQTKRTLSLDKGAWRVAVTGEAMAADDAPHILTVKLSDGAKELATSEMTLRFYSATNATNRLSALRQKLPQLKRDLDAVQAGGQDIAYPLVTFTVLENFVNYAEDDVKHQEVRRALLQIGDMEAMAQRLERDLKDALSGKRRFSEVPRWTGTQRPRIVGPSFIAETATPTHPHSHTRRPVFFVGYGHFGQVRADIEKFPRYGINIIQIEFGPNSVFPSEGAVSDAPVRDTLACLDRAAKAGVAVNLLISPHYFPGWMLEKYPHLRKRRGGFLQYCLHAPEGQELLKRFIAVALTPLKDHPALHSICLSNEPVNVEEPCEFALRDWRDWLQKRHGDIATLNQRWHTDYRRFDEIPLPNPFDATRTTQYVRYDFVRFNQEWFAHWHKMMSDAIHAIAPNLPVHAKGMTWTFLGDGEVRYGADAELFGQFSDINGNDSVNWYAHGLGEFAQGWQGNAMAYDLQRSVKDAPVFNSENHLIIDRDTRPIPPEHVRAALYQQAIHGQSATTIWVWERTFDPRSDFAGSLMHRPACAEATGTVCHDLNRLSEEVTALQTLKPPAVLLHSVTAKVWDGGRFSDCSGKLYTALAFTGLKLGFVTERQLERGELPSAPLLFVPNVAHLSDAAFAGLKRYKGRIVLVGDDPLLTRNEYDGERTEQLPAERLSFDYPRTTWRDLWQALLPKLFAWNVQPSVQVLDDKGQPLTGVEWLCASTPKGIVVNLCNYRNEPLRVTLWRNGKNIGGVDLLSGEKVKGSATLAPLRMRLVRVD